MCSENLASDTVVTGECAQCGSLVNYDGEAVMQCAYSSEECSHCQSRPCDGRC